MVTVTVSPCEPLDVPETSTSILPVKVIPLTSWVIVEELSGAISVFQTSWKINVPILFFTSTYIGAPRGMNKLLVIVTSIFPELISAEENESKLIDFCWGTRATVSTTTLELPPPAVIAASMLATSAAGIISENEMGSVSSAPILSSSTSPIFASMSSVISSRPTESYPIVNVVLELSTVTALAYCTKLFSMGSIFNWSPTSTESISTVLLKT